MKVVSTLLIFSSFFISVIARAQKVTIDIDTGDVRTVLRSISQQTGMAIIYQNSLFRSAPKVTLHVKDTSLREALNMLFKNQRLTFINENFAIIVKLREEAYGANGRIVDQNEEPVRNLTITNQWTHKTFKTNSLGYFHVDSLMVGTPLVIAGTNIETVMIEADNKNYVLIHVKSIVETNLATANINTGYQLIAKKRNTGSDFVVDQELFQQRTDPDIANRLSGTIPGLLPVTNKGTYVNEPHYFTIGGRITIVSNADPLLVVDGFPYAGSLATINPDDVQDITVLRDASAIGMWGARAANGVIVITTKSGKYIPRLRVSFNSSFSIGSKPDIFYTDQLSSVDRIFIDTTLFKIGFFNSFERSRTHPALSPVVEELYNTSQSPVQRLAYFDSLSKLDNRYQQEKYFYRRPLAQHFSTQFATGGNSNNLYFSLGYDHNQPELQGSNVERKTILLNGNIRKCGFEISPSIAYTEFTQTNIDGVPEIPAPYEMLKDNHDSMVAVPFAHRFAYIDTAGNHKLLDWKYRPLQEFQLRNKRNIETDFRVQFGLKYNRFGNFLRGLEASFLMQNEVSATKTNNIHSAESFFTRDLVNSFSQITPSEIYRPIPAGNIGDFTLNRNNTLSLRLKLLYIKKWKSHTLNVLAGRDYIFTKINLSTERLYGYSENKPAGQNNIDYKQLYPMYYFPGSKRYIPYINTANPYFNNYFSNYLAVNFRWRGRYDMSATVRRDESNLYGTIINDKIIPSVSVGLGWNISSERFYHSTKIPFVRLRMSYGGAGNSPGHTIAPITISYVGNNTNGDPMAIINNPSLPDLRWENTSTLNFGFNVRAANDRLEASVDWYQKNSKELISFQPLDPSSGYSSLYTNVGAMNARSLDVVLESKNIIHRLFQWKTSLLFSYVKDYVKHTDDTLQPAWMYCDPGYLTTVPGKPLYGIYSFPFKGLDNSGNPMGPNNNTNYASMVTAPGYSTLVYSGRSTPAIFGSLTNDFGWKQFDLSVTLLYKFNYYFRKNSVNYYNIFNGISHGSTDFDHRWQQKGDEAKTSVPSMPLTVIHDENRDFFYNYSDALVRRADHIRLQTIHLGYGLERDALKKLHLRMATVYFNVSNIGIIWSANKDHIDPDQLTGYLQPKIFTIGFRGTFK